MNDSNWQKIWGPVGVVVFRRGGVAEVFATQGDAVDPTGDIYAGGELGPGMDWVRVGGPGKTFAAGPGDNLQPNIVGLSPDGSGVYLLVLDTAGQGAVRRWELIGGPASAVFAGEAGIYATNPDSGDLYSYDGTPMSWTRIGGPGKTFAVGTHLFGLSPDGSGVWRYSSVPMAWEQVGGPAGMLYAGEDTLCATNPTSGDLYLYQGTPMTWTHIGGPGKEFAVGSSIVGISPDGGSLWRYTGTPMSWEKIAGPVDRVYAYQAQICMIEPIAHDLQYNADVASLPASLTPIQLPGTATPG